MPLSTWGKNDFRSFITLARGRGVDVEHHEAVPTPLGGGMIAHSLIRPAHLTPCHDIRWREKTARISSKQKTTPGVVEYSPCTSAEVPIGSGYRSRHTHIV